MKSITTKAGKPKTRILPDIAQTVLFYSALLMKTSVFHIELTYIIGNSESFEQWQRQTALCAFLAILVNLGVEIRFFGANPPRWPLYCHAIPINC